MTGQLNYLLAQQGIGDLHRAAAYPRVRCRLPDGQAKSNPRPHRHLLRNRARWQPAVPDRRPDCSVIGAYLGGG
jgi:hypothetical protein